MPMISSFQPVYYPMDSAWKVPTREECRRFWQLYHLPEHIREHSRLVAQVAEFICDLAHSKGIPVHTQAVVASALLHDLGKFYCIEHGGAHHQLGASIVMDLTGNPAIAQGVLHHVYWPGELDLNKFFLPLVIIYSDKRVKHDRIVPLATRFEDLYIRYGKTSRMQGLIHKAWEQAIDIQTRLNQALEADLDACTFDSRRLV